MKHKITIFFLLPCFILLAFLPFGNASELLKTSSLVKHYQKHNAENPDFSLSKIANFLSLHYFNSSHQQEEDHSSLPFFSSQTQILYYILPSISFNFVEKLFFWVNLTENGTYRKQYDFLQSLSFWNPPKI